MYPSFGQEFGGLVLQVVTIFAACHLGERLRRRTAVRRFEAWLRTPDGTTTWYRLTSRAHCGR